MNSGGEVRPAGKGSAHIRATAVNGGVYAECTVTVNPRPRLPGLYEAGNDEPVETSDNKLATLLAWIAASGANGGEYTFVLGENETITKTIGIGTVGHIASASSPSKTGNKRNITVTLEAQTGGAVEITKTGQGALFHVEGGPGDTPALVLGSGVTLKGSETNIEALVIVGTYIGTTNYYPGKLEMRDGSRITGNQNVYFNASGQVYANGMGGGVIIAKGSEFLMNGGSIDHNKVESGNSFTIAGGGVFNKGIFVMNAGSISYNEVAYGGSMEFGPVEEVEQYLEFGIELIKGGGVYNDSCTFTHNGGTVSGNIATRDPDIREWQPRGLPLTFAIASRAAAVLDSGSLWRRRCFIGGKLSEATPTIR